MLDTLPAQSGEGVPEIRPEQLIGPEVVRFQAMRIAYFTVDKTSVLPALEGEQRKVLEEGEGVVKAEGDNKIVLNRIVSLKEDSVKAAVK